MDGRVSKRHRISRRSALRGSALGAAGLVGAALIGCGDDDDEAPAGGNGNGTGTNGTPQDAAENGDVTRGGTLRAGIPEDIATFDMHQTTNLYEVNAMTLSYDGLIQYDPFDEGNIIGDLAHEWEIPEDDQIVFHLNEAAFHDGHMLTSEDVAASIERQKNPPDGVQALRQPSFDVLASVETPDERTVIFHMERPSASFLSLQAVGYMAIYSAADIDDAGFDHQDDINGTGAFVFDNYARGSQMQFSRNENYYESDLPYLDGIERFIIPEEVTRLASFQSGDLDMFGPGVTQVADIEGMGDAELLTTTHFSYYTWTIATWKEPWNDERVWEAVSLAIDRESTNQVISEGRGFTGGPCPPGGLWALPEDELAQYPGFSGDMEERFAEARQLLDAAGIEEGTPVSVLSWDLASFEQHALVFTDALQQIGLSPDLTLVERATYDERLNSLDYGDMAANSRNAAMDDPTPVFADNYIEGAGRHYTGLVIPEVEDLYREQESEMDEEARLELAHELQRAYLDVYPLDIAHFGETRLALRSDVQGYGVLYGNSRASRKMQWVWLDR